MTLDEEGSRAWLGLAGSAAGLHFRAIGCVTYSGRAGGRRRQTAGDDKGMKSRLQGTGWWC